MFKVVLADDETIALEGLRTLTDWGELGFEICGACENGEEAFTMIDECSPDLVITDIRMPGIDGLELIKRVRQLDREQPLFIVLSGYGEFEYARTAIRYGVKHYLLKPVIEAEWEKALADITDELELRVKHKMQQNMLANQLLPVAIARMLEGQWAEPEEEIAEQMDYLDEAVLGWTYIHVDGAKSSITEICRKLAGAAGALFIDLPGDQAGLVVENSASTSELAREVYNELSRNSVKGSVSIGPGVKSLRELPVSYMVAAGAAARHLFYSEASGPIDTTKDAESQLSYNLPSADLTEELMGAVERLQEQKAWDQLKEMFRMFELNRTAPEVVRMTGIDIMLKSMELVKEFGGKAEQWSDSFEFFKTKPKSLVVLEGILKDLLNSCMEYIKQHKERGSEHPHIQVECFLKDNYSKPLTVKEIAEHFYINPVYLGQAFIKKNGISILEYIHNLRIDQAKKRLIETGETVRKIAENVGYVHYHHFLREFEKRTTLKPIAYRNQARAEK
ncbi:response regulator [Paenibacillus sp. 19GGS1-52]|uniref:response regulator transcription factor n=1 Tax=Paenibacillus sp. 19GGS1-52 TaxID=2758563 RepID=UPI001EFB7A4C|nr:response regulator [Paenibacillus sp. 19GGS1-52]ULO05266.1 response regulator [Paenibacillus sp. 19GGS1-52]